MIRKALINKTPDTSSEWMDLAALARFEISSEDPEHPIEGALAPDDRYWRAAEDGEQTIRVLFDTPQRISRITLVFEEASRSRTQEFSLSWQGTSGAPVEFVRQQYNFSPPGTTRERENYKVSLEAVSALILVIQPDISKPGRASLTRLLAG